MREVIRHFLTPDAHRSDPAGFVLTQAAHFGAVGAPAFWMLSGLGHFPALLLVGALYAAIEIAQTRFGPQTFRDGFEDWLFVMWGAAFMALSSTVAGALPLTFAAAWLLDGALERSGQPSG